MHSKREATAIYYLAPDFEKPSWGNGILYGHVKLLNRNGIYAAVLHHKRPFHHRWFESDVPVSYLNDSSFKIRENDLLVVPEVNVLDDFPRSAGCKKIVFVQGGFLILHRLEKAVNYEELGYRHVIVTMPNIKKIVDTYFGAQSEIIPPFIAPYFFARHGDTPPRERHKRILFFKNPSYAGAGCIDYDIALKLLVKRVDAGKNKLLGLWDRKSSDGWEPMELKNMTHREVSELMKGSAFFVNLNSTEGFNVTVPEAMAAGCIPLCYEAYGGMDYLEDGHNAYVFSNNYVYPLIDKLFSLIENYDNIQNELDRIRENAYKTALRYTEEETEKSLLRFFTGLLA